MLEQVIWQGGNSSLSLPDNYRPDDYPAKLLRLVIGLIQKWGKPGSFYLEFKTLAFEGEIKTGIDVGPVLVDEHEVRFFFHDEEARKRPTYHLSPPDSVRVNELHVFLKSVSSDLSGLDLPDEGEIEVADFDKEVTSTDVEPIPTRVVSKDDVTEFLEVFRDQAEDDFLSNEDTLALAALLVDEALAESLVEMALESGDFQRCIDLTDEAGRRDGYEFVDQEKKKERKTRAEIKRLKSEQKKVQAQLSELTAHIADLEATLPPDGSSKAVP